jgi:LCP family protein required for cell wall assembly
MGKHNQNIVEKGSKTKNKKKMKTWKKVLIILFVIIFVFAGLLYSYIQNKLNKINYVNLNKEELAISDNVKEGYRNIALFAIDSRDLSSYSGSRSDGIIILSINEKTKDAKLVSVYRDCYVQVEGHGYTKINHAYAYGGPTLAIKTLNTNLDLNISEFVTVNFAAVADAVDLMGGIEIEVKSNELTQLNKYIKETAKIIGGTANTISEAGTYTLDGVQAVAYGIIRKTTGGDYKRTERMRTVIMKTFEKAKKMDVGTLNKLIDTVLPEVQTNITSNEILSLATQIASYNIADNTGWPYNVKEKTIDASYVIPVTLQSNVEQLHKELFDQDDYVVPDSVKEISDTIAKKSGYTK